MEAQTKQTPAQDQRAVRVEKLQKMRQAGADPYTITKYDVDSHAADLKAAFAEGEREAGDDPAALQAFLDDQKERTVAIAGRMMTRRGMGRAVFFDVQDASGRIQAYVRQNELGKEAFKAFQSWDLGDIVGLKGFLFRTKMGEITLHARAVTLLSKSLQPLPEKWHGLKNQDLRYRQRYLDLIVNPGVKDVFLTRSRILQEIRSYLDNLGYLEVETPVLLPIQIAAAARPFQTYHNTLGIPLYLRIETELNLKKLLVGGFERVYEIGRIFRNEGMDPYHNPEFTTIELYQAYTDYRGMMDLIEDLCRTLSKKICGSDTILYQGTEIHLGHAWERLSMVEAVRKYASVDYDAWESDADARACAKEKGIDVPEGEKATKGHVLLALFDAFVEAHLIQPTIIYDYPVENSPLAKRRADNPAFTERFEFFIAGREMGNAFSELNDPLDQRRRMEEQVAARRVMGDQTGEVDEDFLAALEYGMPPTGGLGVGIDRLVMLLTDAASIRDVLLFPTMKPVSGEEKAEISSDDAAQN